ncbi:MAG: cytochrome c [Bdellovibrionales bacterium]
MKTFLYIFCVSLLLVNCAPAHKASSQAEASSTSLVGDAVAGATKYEQNCSLCHGALASSTRRGVTAVQTHTAMSNEPQMMFLKDYLTEQDIADIVAALAF